MTHPNPIRSAPERTPLNRALESRARGGQEWLWAFLTLLFLAAPVQADIQINLGRGNVNVNVPPSYIPGTPMPLVLLLHGFGGTGAGIEAYLQFEPLSDEFGFIYAHPRGSLNEQAQRFWNATDACCGFGSEVDDSGYLSTLIDEIKAQLTVDERRVWIAGHSNGGFMSYRMACDHPDVVAAIASLAGATWDDPADCASSGPVHALQIHGTSDGTVLYSGGLINGIPYPGAVESVEMWATNDGCMLTTDTSQPNLDLVPGLAGDETTVTRYVDGCDQDGSSELWTIMGGGHSPAFSSNFSRAVVEWFYLHPKGGTVDVPILASQGTSGLGWARPNPFASATILPYDLSAPTNVSAAIYDVTGRQVRVLASGRLRAGSHEFRWDGRDGAGRRLASGTYFVRVRTADGVVARKVLLQH